MHSRVTPRAGRASLAVTALALAAGPFLPVFAQPAPATARTPPGPGAEPAAPRPGRAFFQSVPLGDGPWVFDTQRYKIRVSVVTKALENPWGFAFLPNGDILVTERPGRLRIVRSGVLDPKPIEGLPAIHAVSLGGLLDVALHPRFADNRWVYLSYSKPGERGATTAVMRARFDGGGTLADVEDVLVADAWFGGTGPADNGSFGSRLVFDRDGFLYVTLGERNQAPKAQDPDTHLGKILRLRDDGSVPAGNPFVNAAGYDPEIYSLGHRNPLGLALHPATGALWSTEQGPQGGDELNVIVAGKNYGWPVVSFGRNYDGTQVGEGVWRADLEPPLVFWVPVIAVSGLTIYAGDAFPEWRGNAFVGAMRVSGQANTGHIQRIYFNDRGLPIGREPMLTDLKQRIRDVRTGPDGLLYAVTDEPLGAMLKIEPAE
jgi:glucose/arabinose dehydrogenase